MALAIRNVHSVFRAPLRGRFADRTIDRTIARVWARRNLTAEERANLHARSTTPLAVLTASLGGHPRF
ncbi:hypothetical protein M2272_002659 [Mycobacterium frederiksbergense]|uniref:Uncharacterized protein n=1 Tax=Mycolicibacterium frederiksbergense TaxID=117567 RepID=A0ABT6KZA8_9MYCO|nr:hypothetical protein [Mycolicibacterium frederiksbergense]MDH6196019.1 hypothetical protein [Mycolicibacterium frederiksbergense]